MINKAASPFTSTVNCAAEIRPKPPLCRHGPCHPQQLARVLRCCRSAGVAAGRHRTATEGPHGSVAGGSGSAHWSARGCGVPRHPSGLRAGKGASVRGRRGSHLGRTSASRDHGGPAPEWAENMRRAGHRRVSEGRSRIACGPAPDCPVRAQARCPPRFSRCGHLLPWDPERQPPE